MRPDRNEGALPGQVGVELILQVDKARVAKLVKLDVAEDGRGKVRSDLGRLGLDADRSLLALHTHKLLVHLSVWGVPVSRDTYGGSGFEGIGRDAQLWLDVELEGARDPFDAEQVVAVRGDFNLELVRLILGVVRVRHRLHREKRSVIRVHHDDDDGISSKELGKLGTHVLVEFEAILEAQLVKVLGRCVCETVQRSVSQFSPAGRALTEGMDRQYSRPSRRKKSVRSTAIVGILLERVGCAVSKRVPTCCSIFGSSLRRKFMLSFPSHAP